MTFLIAEMSTLLSVRMTMMQRPIDIADMAEEMSPSVGQVPSTSTKVGLEKITPSKKIFLYLFMFRLPLSSSALPT